MYLFIALLAKVLEKFMSRLVQNRVMAHKDLRTLTKYQIILARDQFRKNPSAHIKAWAMHKGSNNIQIQDDTVQ